MKIYSNDITTHFIVYIVYISFVLIISIPQTFILNLFPFHLLKLTNARCFCINAGTLYTMKLVAVRCTVVGPKVYFHSTMINNKKQYIGCFC